MATQKFHARNKDTILTTDGISALLDAGFLKQNLLTDDGVNIQIDEIRARDADGLKLFDDGGNGAFVKDGGNVGVGTTDPKSTFQVEGRVTLNDNSAFELMANAYFNGLDKRLNIGTIGRIEFIAASEEWRLQTGPTGAADDTVNFTTRMFVRDTDVTIPTQLNVDNLRLDGNTISSTDVNGDIMLSPNGIAKLEVNGTPGTSVGGFPSGQFHVTNPSALANSNSVITGHNSFGGNKQLWYLGSTSGSNDNIVFINRQSGSLSFLTSNISRVTIEAGGNTILENQIQIKGGVPGLNKVLTSDAVGLGTWETPTGAGASIFAQLTSSVDQEPTVTTPVVITYDTQDAIVGLTHSTTVNPGEITVDTAGTYFILPQPQVGKSSGGAAQTLNMFMQVDRGSGFVDEPNTNIKVTVSDNTATDVIVLGNTIVLAVGDKIRKMQRVTSPSVGLGLKFTAAEVGPPTVPATPSVIFTMFRIGA